MIETTARAAVEPEFLTVKEVATRLNLGLQTAYDLVYSGKLESNRFGADDSKRPALRVPVASVDAYIARTRTSA